MGRTIRTAVGEEPGGWPGGQILGVLVSHLAFVLRGMETLEGFEQVSDRI